MFIKNEWSYAISRSIVDIIHMELLRHLTSLRSVELEGNTLTSFSLRICILHHLTFACNIFFVAIWT